MNIASLSKITYPDTAPLILHRWRLITELQQAANRNNEQAINGSRREGYKVILLHAPAGYGKTTLLADFTRYTPLPCCWYFLDASDENPANFLTLLLASIRQRFPDFGASLDALLQNIAETAGEQQELFRSFVETLAKRIATEISERFVLFLCDYQVLDPGGITNALVNHFIEYISSNCTLILESRSTPNLNFVFLLAHQAILSIGSEKLRFSAQEIEGLARLQHANVTDQDVGSLDQAFEGWITGMLLGTQLGNPLLPLPIGPEPNPSIALSGQEHLLTYFATYVFAHHSEAYQFLKETSILHSLTAELCNALLSITHAASLLAYLEEHGLFVTRYKRGPDDVYVCLPILRTLLYADLERHHPLQLVDLHLKAVELFRGRQDSEAISHALSAKAFTLAAQLIEPVVSHLFATGEQVLLAHMLDALPDATINLYPRLLLDRANLFLEESLITRGRDFLQRAITAVAEGQNTAFLRVDILLVQAKLLILQGNYGHAQELAREALSHAGSDEVESRATAHQVLGSCAAYLNDFTVSIAEMQQALQLFGRDSQTRPVAKLHTMLANFYGMTGNNSLSEHHRRQAIQCWEHLRDEWGRIDNILGLGAIKGRQGHIEEAMQLFNQALQLSRGTIHYICGEAYALANMGDLYQDQDLFEQALVSYTESLTLSRKVDEVYLIHYIHCQLARTYLLMGDAHGARSILEQLEPEVSSEATTSYEQALFVFTSGILLWQTSYADSAYPYFMHAEAALTATKYEYIQVSIYKAAVLLDLHDQQAALQSMIAVWQLAKECSYEELVRRELSRCPKLLSYVKAMMPTVFEEPSVNVITDRGKKSDSADISQVSPSSASQQNLPVLSIQAFGVPAVYKNEVLLEHWRMTKSMELFFLLLNTPHPLHKERIISYLWPDREELTDQVWRSTLHYLRKAIGANCIHSRKSIYRLQLDAMYVVRYDVTSFQDSYTQARMAQDAGDYEAASVAFEHMVTLYKGDFAASFYNDWCIFRRDELRQSCINAHHQLAMIAQHQQNFEKSISHWRQMIAMDTMIEAAHEGLIRCYLHQGKRHFALRHYNDYRSFLEKELGVLPGKSLQALLQN